MPSSNRHGSDIVRRAVDVARGRRRMEMQVVESDGVSLAILDGRFDIAGAQAVDLRFSALAGAVPALGVDMTKVTFLASMGVRTLMLSAKTMLRRGATIVVFGADENVEKVLRATGFDEIVALYPDRDAAMAALKALSARDFPGTLEAADGGGGLGGRAMRAAGACGRRRVRAVAVSGGIVRQRRAARRRAEIRAGADAATGWSSATTARRSTRRGRPAKRLEGPSADFEIGGFGVGLVQKFARPAGLSRGPAAGTSCGWRFPRGIALASAAHVGFANSARRRARGRRLRRTFRPAASTR